MRKARDVVAAGIEAFNTHDEERIRSLHADDAILGATGDVRREGVNAVVRYTMGWLRAFPDARLHVALEVASGEWVAQRLVFEGTHEEAWLGPDGEIPATGRQLRLDAVAFVRVERGLIRESYAWFDPSEVLAQLGLTPELAPHA